MWKIRTDEKLEKGMKIRWHGLEGFLEERLGGESFGVCFQDAGYIIFLAEALPPLEIWIDEPRISREAADALTSWISRKEFNEYLAGFSVIGVKQLTEKIESMVGKGE